MQILPPRKPSFGAAFLLPETGCDMQIAKPPRHRIGRVQVREVGRADGGAHVHAVQRASARAAVPVVQDRGHRPGRAGQLRRSDRVQQRRRRPEGVPADRDPEDGERRDPPAQQAAGHMRRGGTSGGREEGDCAQCHAGKVRVPRIRGDDPVVCLQFLVCPNTML